MKRIADLSVFVAVVKAGSLSEASREIGLSISSISKYISRVEESLGVRVLVRSSRGLRLTEEGRELYGRIHTLLADLEGTLEEIRARRDVPIGGLKVNVPEVLARGMDTLTSDFSDLHDQLTVQLFVADREVDFITEDVDVVVTVGEPTDKTVVSQRLMPHPCLVCASPKYLKGRKAPRQPKDLKNHDCLILDCHGSPKGRWRFQDQDDRGQTVEVSGKLSTDNHDTLMSWLLDGKGVALIGEWEAAPHLKSGELVPLIPRHTVPTDDFYLVYAAKTLLPAKTRLFLQFLEENLHQLRGE